MVLTRTKVKLPESDCPYSVGPRVRSALRCRLSLCTGSGPYSVPYVTLGSRDGIGKIRLWTTSSGNNRAFVPTTTEHIAVSEKQVLTLLHVASNVIPVPLVQETIGVAPKVIELCEDASPAVEERVKELKCRVGHLMIIIIDHVTSQNDVEGSKKAFVNAMKLSTAMDGFKLANGLRDSSHLRQLQSRQEETHGLVQHALDEVTRERDQSSIQQQMPLKPEIFHGRETLVQDIARFLIKEESSPACILGPGGMRKTSVSLAIVESARIRAHFFPEHLFWQMTLSKIISQLDASTQPRLILLDNFETPWNAPGGAQKQVGDILRQLAMLKHVSILVTMRGSQAACDKAITRQLRDIQPTDEEACIRIFHDINPDSENEPDVKVLLGTHTFRCHPHGQSRQTRAVNGEGVVERIIEVRAGHPSQDEQSMNRRTTKDDLSWWAPTLDVSMIPSAIVSLSAAALLVKKPQQSTTSLILFVLPVVQSFMQQHNRIEEDLRAQTFSLCCQYVLDNACRCDDPRFRVNAKDLAAEGTNIHSVLFSRSPSPDLSEQTIKSFIALSWHYCDTMPNPEVASRAGEATKGFGVGKYIPSAVWCLSRTYYDLANKPTRFSRPFPLITSLNDLVARFCQLCPACGRAEQDCFFGKGRRSEMCHPLRQPRPCPECCVPWRRPGHGRAAPGCIITKINPTRRWELLKMRGSVPDDVAQVGNRSEVAKGLEYMGYGYLLRGDYGRCYEGAAIAYCKLGEAWVEERCRVARIKRKREENDVVIGFRRPHLSVEKSLFYGPVQVSFGMEKLIGRAPRKRRHRYVAKHGGLIELTWANLEEKRGLLTCGVNALNVPEPGVGI
ncbi:uncharacterized protein LACBIDRAFT_326687 [Laccaria bicolor S238N-H82]|uniref:Predicted protein n=1 Tax=Laccaria bicolor (strain S238N-H82 / ATCC MYA-4686) TaxID=486041 RepID=B0D849_LACBS|nr:uncharacterized protein LACBIDRAFT_326687 [Laccaria bicolor S238N-H82]EDR09014.1 predicted protein [Laccaria bicolor S238N-H82]|eukprot:XP_001880327.1 predicted protein [Laccaria bicolor S238N-H82]